MNMHVTVTMAVAGYSGSVALYLGNLSNNSWPGTVEPEVVEYTGLEWCRDVILGVVLATLSLLTIVGNAMVLHAVRTERRLQSVCIYYMQSGLKVGYNRHVYNTCCQD